MASRVVLFLIAGSGLTVTVNHYLTTFYFIVLEESGCFSHGNHFTSKDCVGLIQVESFVMVKASFSGAALNHYTCTNMLIYLRAIVVSVHIFRFNGLAEHVPIGNVHCNLVTMDQTNMVQS